MKLLEIKDVKKGPCNYCKKDPTTAFVWADGRAVIYTCDDHKDKAKHQIEVVNNDKISTKRDIIG